MTTEVTRVVTELLRLLGAPLVAPARRRVALRERLTTTPPGGLPRGAWPLLEALFAAEAPLRPVVDVATLPRLSADGWGARVSHLRGDLTTQRVDAIVNAANDGLTGCYRPLHACVDNAIHTAAGPWLREECNALVRRRGRPEPTGTATATKGWFLPARHVLHTVGPIVPSHDPGDRDAEALARCYHACLDEADAMAARSVAFCSLSTGVFGYPIARAAPVAIASVRSALDRLPSIEHVVLVTYSPSDAAVYDAALHEALHVEARSSCA